MERGGGRSVHFLHELSFYIFRNVKSSIDAAQLKVNFSTKLVLNGPCGVV